MKKPRLGHIGKIIHKIARKYFDTICYIGDNDLDPMNYDCKRGELKIFSLIKKCRPMKRLSNDKYSQGYNDGIEDYIDNLGKLLMIEIATLQKYKKRQRRE